MNKIASRRNKTSKNANDIQHSNDDDRYVARVTGIDYGVLDDLLGYAIRRAQIVIYEDFADAVGDQSCTPQRFAVLVIVGANPGLSQARLAHVMGIARPGVTALIDFWENRGCVERKRGAIDRRSFGIYLTAQGKQELKKLSSVVKAHDEKMLDSLSLADTKVLFRLLEKLIATDR